MTDAELEQYLSQNGYPDHLVRAGKPGLIQRGRKSVADVEHGYKLGLEDYRNALDLRAIIALAGIEADVDDLDRKFEAMLTAREVRVWESAAGDAFWDFGYPRNASGDLLGSLKAEGL